jgi:hypothetical protein
VAVRTQSQVPGTLTPGAAAVQVTNQVRTQATQAGTWEVTLSPTAAVGVAVPDFVRVGQRYLVHPSGESVVAVTVNRIDRGWILVSGDGGRRWLNLTQAVSIQETP